MTEIRRIARRGEGTLTVRIDRRKPDVANRQPADPQPITIVKRGKGRASA